MRHHRRLGIALARTHHQRRHQAGNTGVDVHHGAAREVEHAHGAEPPASPYPVADRCVHQRQPRTHEDQHGGELHALGKRADDQRRGNDGEGHLEGHEDRFRNRSIEGINADAFHERFAQTTPIRPGVAEGDAVGIQRPQHGDQCGNGEALHHRRQHVLGSHHAGVEQRQARDRHHQHQRRRGQHPGRVASIQLGSLRWRRCRRRRRGGRCRRFRCGRFIAEGKHRRHQQQYDAEGAEQLFQVEMHKHGIFSCIKAHLCRFHRCGYERPAPGLLRISCRPRSCRCGPPS